MKFIILSIEFIIKNKNKNNKALLRKNFNIILIQKQIENHFIMSLINKIFGKNAKEKPPTPQEAIQRIRDVEDLLGKKSQFLEKKINDELDTARKHGTKNKRSKPLDITNIF